MEVYNRNIFELFKKYTVEDFILDKRFRRFVKSRDKFIDEFIVCHPEKREEICLAMAILKELENDKCPQSDDRKNQLWEQIIKKHTRQVRFNYFRYAAVFLLMICIGIIFLNKKKSNYSFVALKDIDNSVSLILSDGIVITDDNIQPRVTYSSDGASIALNDTVLLRQSATQNEINQLIVPYGKRSYVLLSDGSKVWLNSGSKLAYSPSFKGRIREVFLEGEAYFDVVKDTKPFIVKTHDYSIKVLGTKFNITAYKQDNQSNTSLVEGKVSLTVNGQLFSSEVILTPNQKASFSQENKNFQISGEDNIENSIAWTNGYLLFNNEEISSVIKKVSRYYNITIEIILSDKGPGISGKLDLKDDPERVLKGLAIISNTKFLKHKDKYILHDN